MQVCSDATELVGTIAIKEFHLSENSVVGIGVSVEALVEHLHAVSRISPSVLVLLVASNVHVVASEQSFPVPVASTFRHQCCSGKQHK